MYSIEIVGDDKLISDLTRIEKMLGYGREDILDQVASQVARQLAAAAPAFKGYLKASMKVLYRAKDERWIGAGNAGPSSQYPPSHYARYVEKGGGPSGLPNISDIALRMGISDREAFAFAKYLRDSGKAIRTPTNFISNVADNAAATFYSSVSRWLNQIL